MNDSNNSGGESQQTGVIYKITNKINGKIYVGQTRQKLSKRIYKHKYYSKKGSPGLGAAIAKYGWENFTVEVVEIFPVEQLNEREKFYIVKFNSKAPNGYNLTDGGEGHAGCSPSEETRTKISASNKGRRVSAETRAKIATAHKGKSHKPHSQETRDKISAGNKGRHVSAETRAKIAAANKARDKKLPDRTGKKHTAETKAKISASNKGKKRRPETRAKLSASKKGKNNPFYGKHHSEETRAKMSASKKGKKRKKSKTPSPQKGKPRSQETKAKIAASVKVAWARKKLESQNKS